MSYYGIVSDFQLMLGGYQNFTLKTLQVALRLAKHHKLIPNTKVNLVQIVACIAGGIPGKLKFFVFMRCSE